MAPEFTIEKAPAGPVPVRGAPKTPLRLQIEKLKIGEVLRWRPTGEARDVAHHCAYVAGKALGAAFTTRKVDGGYDIYRTA
jgi:hypothetical protein